MEDYAQSTSEVDIAIEIHVKVRILVRMYEFLRWTVGADWDEAKIELHHFSDIEMLALVSETKPEAGTAMFCKPITIARVPSAAESTADEAARQIHHGIPQAA